MISMNTPSLMSLSIINLDIVEDSVWWVLVMVLFALPLIYVVITLSNLGAIW